MDELENVAPLETEEVVETEELETEETVETPTVPVKPVEEKVVPYDRFKKVNEELKALKSKAPAVVNKSLDVEDYIDISTSLEGLDPREKEYISQQHKLSGRPLKEIRSDENFLLWQTAYRDKVDKENRVLAPSGKQGDVDRPKSITERLKEARTIDEKEKIMVDAGLYKSPRPAQKSRPNIATGY